MEPTEKDTILEAADSWNKSGKGKKFTTYFFSFVFSWLHFWSIYTHNEWESIRGKAGRSDVQKKRYHLQNSLFANWNIYKYLVYFCWMAERMCSNSYWFHQSGTFRHETVFPFVKPQLLYITFIFRMHVWYRLTSECALIRIKKHWFSLRLQTPTNTNTNSSETLAPEIQFMQNDDSSSRRRKKSEWMEMGKAEQKRHAMNWIKPMTINII